MLEDISIPKLITRDSKGRDRTKRGRAGLRPRIIICHIQEGTNDLAEYFKTIDADSTVYSRRSGQLVRILPDEATPWTNGTFTNPNLSIPAVADAYRKGIYPNDISLTIEHEGYYTWDFTEAQLESTARMVAYWCDKWDIPCDANHVIGHRDIDSVTRANCPGYKFPFARVIARALSLLQGAGKAAPVEDPNAHEFKETGYWVVNTAPGGEPIKFYDYWQRIGLAQLGYPISPAEFDPEFGRIRQWFERGRVEYHPENESKDYKVLEGLTGRECLDLRAQVAKLKAENQKLLEQTWDLQSQIAELKKGAA